MSRGPTVSDSQAEPIAIGSVEADALDALRRHVARFQAQQETYKSPYYNEAQVRTEFIDPLFRHLGWDIENAQGTSDLYKDVVHEDSIQIEGVPKAPDYSFRIGGVRKFFVEAKRPSLLIKQSSEAAFQLRRYGWSAKLPVSILTNFVEIAVYDTRVRPEREDQASTARIMYLDLPSLVSGWDDLYSKFSRAAMVSGGFAQFVQATKTPRGTLEVDEAFLREIEAWRSALARVIATRNDLSERDLNYSVQAIIDRIIFLRICEDRGIEAPGRLQQILGATNLYSELVGLFELADQRYNSGLFHFRNESDQLTEPDRLTPQLVIDNAVLTRIIRSLYYPAPYDFRLLPVAVLGQIYERFLGKVIRLTTPGHRAVIEEKPDVRKAGGVYYTPTYVVRYLVDRTVGPLLDGKTPRQVGRFGNVKSPPIRILDPACGSGSFLVGAYEYLLNWYLTAYVAEDARRWSTGRNPRLFQVTGSTSDAQWQLTLSERRRILTTHIFGVDIDSQAVEVTKLSLLLKVLEGSAVESIGRTMRLFHERALPDLSNNIKCGNSLIGPDYYSSPALPLLDLEERLRVNAFDWPAEFAGPIDDGGFDVVIGNPPYRRERDYKYLLDDVASTSFGRRYRSARMDLWYYFVHKGLDLLTPAGRLGFIVNSFWTSGTGADKLITRLEQSAHVDEIFSLGNLRVFAKVSGQHMLMQLSNMPLPTPTVVRLCVPKTEDSAEPFVEGYSAVVSFPKRADQMFHNGKVDLQPPVDSLLEKLEAHPPLDAYGIIRQGIAENPASINAKTNAKFGNRWVTGEGVFTLAHDELAAISFPDEEQVLLRPYHDLRDLGRYYLAERPSLTLIYSSRLTCPQISRFPGIRSHLERFRPVMEARRETKSGSNQWWHLHWPREERLWKSGKVLSVQMGERPQFVSAVEPVYVSFSVNVFLPNTEVGESLDYFTGLLNSRLMWKWYQHNAKSRGVGLEINGNVLSRSPIRRIDFGDPSDIALHDRLAEEVATASQLQVDVRRAANPHTADVLRRQIQAADDRIDTLVFELYRLSVDEIEVVRAATILPHATKVRRRRGAQS